MIIIKEIIKKYNLYKPRLWVWNRKKAASILIRKKMSSDIVSNLIINEKKNELVNKNIK